jgi:FAD/FMN-containing dehydrogenase
MWGLTLDTVQSLDVVLANGTIATVSGRDDLLWVRGMWPIKRLHCLIEFIRR